jgi:hypothetical protein
VARGYLGRPALSAERFVADRFGGASGGRLYRTGDRGRWRHDGELEHLGRLDFQLKLRGHRIEPGEIEAQLAGHPAVGESVVVAREAGPDDVRLVAYVVARGAMPAATALRAHLQRTLPEYMIPQHFVALAAMPLMPNGKIDRSALPAPDTVLPEAGVDVDVPDLETPSERLIAGVWSALLRIEPVGPDDNFFSLGGHSLLAMQAIDRIERMTGVRLSPQRFAFESLAQLAAGIAGTGGASPPATKKTMVGRLMGALRRH